MLTRRGTVVTMYLHRGKKREREGEGEDKQRSEKKKRVGRERRQSKFLLFICSLLWFPIFSLRSWWISFAIPAEKYDVKRFDILFSREVRVSDIQ
jgi:hypothetical protein